MADSVAVTTGHEVVHLRVPACPSHLRLVLLMVEDLAGQRDFDLEVISELRIAADEACAQLMDVAAADSTLDYEVRATGPSIEMLASVPRRSGVSLGQSTFRWRVLSSLVDEVSLLDTAPDRIGIRMCKSDSRID